MKKGYKLCPYCGEELREITNKCHFCGESLEEQHFSTNNKISFKKNENNSNSKSGNVGIIVPLTLIIGIIVFLIAYRLFGNKITELNNQIKELNLENNNLQEKILELSEEKEIIQNIGSRTCTGKGVNGKIQGFANCTNPNGGKYSGDIWNNNFNGKGKMVTVGEFNENSDGYFYNGLFIAGKIALETSELSYIGDRTYYYDGEYEDFGFNGKGKMVINGEISDGYFYHGSLVAGKLTKDDGAIKGLRNTGGNLELGKMFYKFNGASHTWIGEWDENFGENGKFYGMQKVNTNTPEYGEVLIVGDFDNALVYNGYVNMNNGCYKSTNGNVTENTRTITNTVYRDNGINLSNNFVDLYQLGGKYNPYTVNLNVN